MRSITLSLLLLASLLSSRIAAADQERPFIDEPEAPVPDSVVDKDTAWKEAATKLPPWPRDSDLVEFRVDDPASRFRQFIDGRHISVGADGAVRYTLVIDSGGGARNVSFEGLRCTPSGAFKIYAYGSNGRFERAEGDWIPIKGRGHDKIHRDLHQQILCIPRNFEPRPKKDMLRAMRTQVPHEANRGFATD